MLNLDVEELPSLVMFGLDVWSCCLRPSRSDVTFRTVPDVVRNGGGSMARSSMDEICRASHIDPPDSDSLELILRSLLEAAEVGRMTGEVTAVDGLDFSA